MKRALALLAFFVAAPAWGADDSAGMGQAANNFLSAYASLHLSAGVPSPQTRARLQAFVSPALLKSLAEAEAAEARFAARIKNMPPLISGDLFTSLYEGATSWKLGACTGDGKTGRCDVSYTHANAPGMPGAVNAAPVRWTDTLLLVNTASGWRIDDIAYDAGFAFGNSGRLSQTLAMVKSEAP